MRRVSSSGNGGFTATSAFGFNGLDLEFEICRSSSSCS